MLVALVSCSECGNKISNMAQSCPHCGLTITPIKTTEDSAFTRNRGCGDIVLYLLVILVCMGVLGSALGDWMLF